MGNVKFSRWNAAAHFVEGLNTWATQKRAEVYPGVIPAGAERYPFVAVETTNVRKVDETKDGGTDLLEDEVTVTVAVKEKLTKSGQEWAGELADDIVDAMDATAGAHDGFVVRGCHWTGGTPGYDAERACYFVELSFSLEVMAPKATPTATEPETATE